jgi:transposase
MCLPPGIKLGTNIKRKSYASDVRDEEWAFCAIYLTLMTEQAPQRVYPLREIFNALCYLVKMGGVWRMMPHDLPPWHLVYHQAKHGFVLLPRRWVMERSFAWAARFRRLARDYERLPATLAGCHWLAFVTLMLSTLFGKS